MGEGVHQAHAIALPRAAPIDFAAAPRLSLEAMNYRIEISQTRAGYARIDLPGRILALEATRRAGALWQVGVTDLTANSEGTVTVRADNAGDAVWRVARAAVRALAELTGSPLDDDIRISSDDRLSNSA